MSTYTVLHPPVGTFPPDWSSFVTPIFEARKTPFKINYSQRSILHNRETAILRFDHVLANNACVLTMPRLISTRSEFEQFITTVQERDAQNYAFHTRPNTKWEVETIPLTCFNFYHITDFPQE